jgi:hypothetical protein
VYHQIAKSGCGEEKRRFETAEAMRVWLAILSVVAVRVFQLRCTLESQPNAPATQGASAAQIEWVRRFVKHRGRSFSVRDFVRGVARLGGFLGRKHDGEQECAHDGAAINGSKICCSASTFTAPGRRANLGNTYGRRLGTRGNDARAPNAGHAEFPLHRRKRQAGVPALRRAGSSAIVDASASRAVPTGTEWPAGAGYAAPSPLAPCPHVPSRGGGTETCSKGRPF